MPDPDDRHALPVIYATDADGSTVTLVPERRRRAPARYPWRFATMFRPALLALCAIDRPAAYYRVLFASLAMFDPIEWRTVSARTIADATGLSRISVERALSQLTADRVLLTRGRASAVQRRLSRRVASLSSVERWADQPMDRELLSPDPADELLDDMELLDARGR